MDRYRVNDVLTALAAEMGVELDDDTLNDLTHHVADALEPDARQRKRAVGHVLRNVYDAATVEIAGTIDRKGNFVTGAEGYQVIDLDGDNYIYCETCNKRVYTNDEHGLSEEWQVL